MKKIGYVINSIRNNGPSKVLINMVCSLSKKKYEPIIVTLINENNSKIVSELKNKNIKVIELNLPKKISTLFKAKIVQQRIDELDLSMLHIHGHITLFLCRKLKLNKIVTVHNRLYEDFKVVYGKFLGMIINLLYIHYLKKCDKVVCCSSSSYLLLRNMISNSTYVRNGIDFPEIDSRYRKKIKEEIRSKLNISSDSIIYIYAGNFTKTKRVAEMFEFFSKSRNKNEYLIALGDGPLYKKMLTFEDNHIKLLGFVNNVSDYMLASDIYISFSESEGFSISIIEALHCNLKLLLSNIASHKECIEIDRNIYIGECFDLTNFKTKKDLVVKRICEKESSSFQKKYLSSKKMMEEYEKIYSNILISCER